MKSTSLYLLTILLSTLTSIATANESRDAPTESCSTNYTLPDNQWRQVSLPCVPAGSGSVADVFGDDIADAFGAVSPTYETSWVVYKYDLSTSGGYIKLEKTDTLDVGVGYWIVQQSGGDATLDLPANSSSAAPIQSDACPSDAGCFEIPLKTKAGAVGWNMIGRPSHVSSTLGDTRIHADTDACTSGCDLDTANSGELVHNQLWTYDVSSYTLATNPDGTLEPWVGYWAATLQSADGKSPKLLVPKVDAPPLDENPLSGRVTATTGVALSGVTVKVLQNGVEQSTTTTTNAEGQFGLPLNAASVYTLTFSAPGYANQVQRVKTSVAGHEVNLDVILTPRGEQQTVPDDSSVTLTGSDGATVSLNPQFVDSQGNAVNASDGIKLTITPVDVSSPAGVAAFPGDFAGVPEGQSDASPIVSYGTVEYQFTRASNGEELQLKAGEQADIQIPIYTKKHQDGTAIKAGDTIPLWSLNEATGLWTQEGTGTVVASTNSPTGFALQAAVSHFSWWNADVTMDSANAIITVNAPEAGTALIKARTAADLAWGPNTVDTVIAVGASTNALPIPSSGEVCFWAEVSFTSGNNATTPESCVTAAPNATVNVSLGISDEPLELVANPSENVTTYINTAMGQTKVQPITLESNVSYALESGAFPAGVNLTPINDTSAVISGVPTEAGNFTPVIKGTDVDGNTATLALNYTIIDGVAPPITREQLETMIANGEDVSRVNTSQITDMSYLFSGLPGFDQDIGRWDVSNVTNMEGMFLDTTDAYIRGEIIFNQDISNWNVGNVTNMAEMFAGAYNFNQDIGKWDVGNVTDMSGMFYGAIDGVDFNQDISRWNVSNVTDMRSMFNRAMLFNQDISGWDVSNVTDMSAMFSYAPFNQDISNWDVSNVTDMSAMFSSAPFNQDLSSWDVSNVTNMSFVFRASSFNQDISSWDVSNVTDMNEMFSENSVFNQDISGWDVSNVINMSEMFSENSVFNQDISGWDVSNVTGMYGMFIDAKSFTNQDLSGWNVSNVTEHDDFFEGAGPGNIEPNWPNEQDGSTP